MVPQHEQRILLRVIGLQPVRVSTCRRGRVGLELARREYLSGKVARTNVGIDEVDGFAFMVVQGHRRLDSKLDQVPVHQNQLEMPDRSARWERSAR